METILVDSGFVSEAAVVEVEEIDVNGGGTPVVLAAMGRKSHHRSVEDLEKKEDPSAPAEGASFQEKMKYRTATKAGREQYKQRQQTIEPVFGIIKDAMGFRRFAMRGKAKVALEWTLVCLSYNMRRVHRMVSAKLEQEMAPCA